MATNVKEDQFNRTVNDLIEEAQLLLRYAAQQGLDVDKNVISVIVKSKHLVTTDKWTPDVETEFWDAFNYIAKKVKPVNIESLKATAKIYEAGTPFIGKLFRMQKVSIAEKAVWRYRMISAAFLLILVISQIVWSYGISIVTEINKLPKSIEETTQKIQNIKAVKGSAAADDPEMSILEAKIEEYKSKYDASFVALQKWNNLIRLKLPQQEMTFTKEIESGVKPIVILKKKIERQIITLQDAQFVLQVLQVYLLPLLYGFVGSCAYILRTLINEIKNVTYTSESNIGYLLRLQLGGLAGLAIGWFASPETFSIVKSLSPFALAFAAGYSVELLFSVLDRIISAFSVEGPRSR